MGGVARLQAVAPGNDLLVGDTPVASGDSLYLHVDTGTGKVSPFPEDRAAVAGENAEGSRRGFGSDR